jgi:hypothetical protein
MFKVLGNDSDIHVKQLPGIYVLQSHLVLKMCLLIVSNKHKLLASIAHRLMSAISGV